MRNSAKIRIARYGLAAFYLAVGAMPAYAAEIPLSDTPLFLQTPSLPNVLVILDNSNSMDEAANGSAAGSADPDSKSEIARGAVKDLISQYTGKINMGLMAYQQSGVSSRQLHNSPYDASFDPANYDPTYTGDRDSPTKRYRTPNLSDPGHYIYYNVALPFYSAANLDSAYCYSTTADFDNGSETYPGGPWDNYRCFHDKTGDSDTVPTFGNVASETAAGFTNYWFSSTFWPTDSDLAQNILDFGTFLTWDWVSQTWFSNSSPGRGYLHVPIADLDATQAGKLNIKLDTSQFVTNAPTDPASPLQNAGLTPLQGTLLTARDYFAGTLGAADEGYSADTYPLPESCGYDYVVLVTDGLPSVDQNGNAVTDVATALNDTEAAAQSLADAGVKTYVVGFALPYGVDPSQLNSIATAGGTGQAYDAADSASLQDALDAIFNNIELESSAAAAVALNTTSWSDESRLFQAKFNSTDWSGDLLAYPIYADGSLGSATNYSNVLDSQDWNTGREILTSSGGTGTAFRWNNLSGTLQDLLNDDPATGAVDGLGEARVEFLRGGMGDASFRSRTSVVGDLINSTPAYVDIPAFNYPNSLESAAYGDFRALYADRTPMLYIGGNDGMLHGFNVKDGDPDEGKELIAYVPEEIYANLNQLSDPDYQHRYYVDGSPNIGDTFYSGSWHTTLVGGLNAGGQGYYALDITNPADTNGGDNYNGLSKAPVFDEANANSLVLWEVTDEDDADLGYSFSQPAIVKMATGQWAAVFGNGYNNTEADGHASTTGHAYLYFVDIQTGTLIRKIDTGVGTTTTPNGLSTPAPVDINGDYIIDYVYAGDLYGNLWKFDVTSSNTNQWASDYMSGGNPEPLFTAVDTNGTAQPITSRPEVAFHPTRPGYMVYFGTGKYLENADNSSTEVQTFYGIWDKAQTNLTAFTRTSLVEQTITETAGFDYELRLVSDNAIDWDNQNGWFIDLPASGEKQVTNSILRNGKIIFTTLIPSTSACEAGGTGWLMEVDMENGGEVEGGVFDLNNDGVFTSGDYVTITDDQGNTTTVPASGKKSKVGILPSPAILMKGNREFKYTSGSTGQIETTVEKAGGVSGRVSWKQLSVQ